MLIVGSLLAAGAGVAIAWAALLQKREAVLVGTRVGIVRLLLELARKPWWAAAVVVGIVGWGGEAAALALAPVAVTAPLLGTGQALLVALGIRWLGERFRARELAAVALVSLGGAASAVASEGTGVVRTPLPVGDQLLAAGIALAAGLAVAAIRRGIDYALAAGLLYAATGVATKEIGDAFALHGWSAIGGILAGPALWTLLLLATIAEAFMQAAFQRANAASALAASSAVSTGGLVAAGFLLYGEPFPAGAHGLALAVGIAAVVLGAGELALRPGPNSPDDDAGPTRRSRRRRAAGRTRLS